MRFSVPVWKRKSLHLYESVCVRLSVCLYVCEWEGRSAVDESCWINHTNTSCSGRAWGKPPAHSRAEPLHTTLSAQPIHHRGSTPITAYHWCQATLVCCVWIPAHGRHVNAANSLSSTPKCTGLVGKCRCYTQKAKNKKMNHAVPRRDHRTESETSWCSTFNMVKSQRLARCEGTTWEKTWRGGIDGDKDGPRQM